MKEDKKYNLETMTGAGKKIELVGREYEILPVNISDMIYILGENSNERLILIDEAELEKDPSLYKLFGHNLIGNRKDIFLKIINKYVFYKERPMTEELLIEHNWSFKEIGKFLLFWTQEVSE